MTCVALLAASCTGGDTGGPRRSGPTADPRLRGSVLLSTDFRGGLATLQLPDGSPEPIELPAAFRVVFGAFQDDGSIVAVVQEQFDEDRVYRVVDGSPEPVGPPLRDRFGLTFSLAGDTLLAAGCGERPIGHVLDLNAPTEWRRVEAACGAALSPDAGSLAWSPDGRVLVSSSIGGGNAHDPILELGDIEGLERSLGSGVRIGDQFAWGRDRVAITASSGDRQAAIVTGEGRPPYVASLGGTGPVARAFLSWQPEGSLLAVMMWNNLEGIVRVLDPEAEATRIVAMLPDPPRSVIWSPRGDAILAASDVRWTFVTPDGEWLRSTPVPRGESLPLDWGP